MGAPKEQGGTAREHRGSTGDRGSTGEQGGSKREHDGAVSILDLCDEGFSKCEPLD